jgi:hypothetical protein
LENIMKRLIPLLLPLALAGCVKVAPATAVSVADRIYTVDEFLAQPDLRKKVSAVCSNDPGRIGQDPNCINVRRADRIASAGSTADMPRIVP